MNILSHLNKYRTKTNRLLFFMVADVVFIVLAVWLSFFLRFDYSFPSRYFGSIWLLSILYIFFTIPIFYLQKLYTFSWSFVSTRELITLFKSLVLSFIFTGAAIFISKDFYSFFGFPRSVLPISYFLIFLFTGGIRLSKRIYLSAIGSRMQAGQKRTLIVGAGDAGEQIIRSISSTSNHPYLPVGFADDSMIKQKISIHGVRVLGKISDIPKIVEAEKISQIIIALPTAGSKTVKDAVELGRKAGVKNIKIFPPFLEIIKGNVPLGDLKNVEVEDLLGRDSVNLDTREIEKLIKDKTVLITGAAGSIGSELSRQTAKFSPTHLVLLDQDETGIFNIAQELDYAFADVEIIPLIADIRDVEKIGRIFKNYQPQIVFHAAAYKHVPLMEEHPDQAVKNNVFGTKALAEASVKNNVEKFIFISTDKAVNPTSVMGATKRIGEIICQIYNQKNITKFISVRFGNVLDSRGSVIPIFREQIKRGGPVQVTHPKMKRYFMLNSEACLLVLQAGAMGKGIEVFVLDMGEPIEILDLAKEMIKLSGYEPDKDIAIVFKGMRPGEKLFEEILTAEEGTSSTKHQRIFIAKTAIHNTEELLEKIEKLHTILPTENKYDLMKALKSIVSSYRIDKLHNKHSTAN